MRSSATSNSRIKPPGHWFFQRRWDEEKTNHATHTPFSAHKRLKPNTSLAASENKPSKRDKKEWVAKCIFSQKDRDTLCQRYDDEYTEACDVHAEATRVANDARVHINTLNTQINDLRREELTNRNSTTRSSIRERYQQLQRKRDEYITLENKEKSKLPAANEIINRFLTRRAEDIRQITAEKFKARKRVGIIEVVQQEIFRLRIGGKQPKTRLYVDEEQNIWILSEHVPHTQIPKVDYKKIKKIDEELALKKPDCKEDELRKEYGTSSSKKLSVWDERNVLCRKRSEQNRGALTPVEEQRLQTIEQSLGQAKIEYFTLLDKKSAALDEESDKMGAKKAPLRDSINGQEITHVAELDLVAGMTFEMDYQVGNIVISDASQRGQPRQAIKIDGGLSFGPVNKDVVPCTDMKDFKKEGRKFKVKTKDLESFASGPTFYVPTFWHDYYRAKQVEDSFNGEIGIFVKRTVNKDQIKLIPDDYTTNPRYLFDFHRGLLKINILPPALLKALIEFISDDEELNAELIPLALDIDKQYRDASKGIASFNDYLGKKVAADQYQTFRQHLENFHPMGKVSLYQLAYSPNNASPIGREHAKAIAEAEMNKNFYHARFGFIRRYWQRFCGGGIVGGGLAAGALFLLGLLTWGVAPLIIIGAAVVFATVSAVVQSAQAISDADLGLLPLKRVSSPLSTPLQHISGLLPTTTSSGRSLTPSTSLDVITGFAVAVDAQMAGTQANKVNQHKQIAEKKFDDAFKAALQDSDGSPRPGS